MERRVWQSKAAIYLMKPHLTTHSRLVLNYIFIKCYFLNTCSLLNMLYIILSMTLLTYTYMHYFCVFLADLFVKYTCRQKSPKLMAGYVTLSACILKRFKRYVVSLTYMYLKGVLRCLLENSRFGFLMASAIMFFRSLYLKPILNVTFSTIVASASVYISKSMTSSSSALSLWFRELRAYVLAHS